MSGSSPQDSGDLSTWIEGYGGVGSEAGGSEGISAAFRALREALARPGRDRSAAHALLAADALLTRACEEAADAADPETELLRVLQGVPMPPAESG